VYDQIKDNFAAHETNKAALASPTFTGTPLITTTPAGSDNSHKIADTAFVKLNSIHPIASTIVCRTNGIASSLPKTFAIAAGGVSGDTVTVTTADVGTMWHSNPQNILYLCIYNSTRGTYAWMKSSPSASSMRFTAAVDVSGWQAGDTLTTSLYGVLTCATSADILIYDLSPFIAAHPTITGCFVAFQVAAATPPTANAIFTANSLQSNSASVFGFAQSNPSVAGVGVWSMGLLMKPPSGSWYLGVRMSGTSVANYLHILQVVGLIGDD
jgi:hypothetical protein